MKKFIIALFVCLFLASVAAPALEHRTRVQSIGAPVYTSGVKHASLNHPKKVRTWRQAAIYDLKTLKRVKHYGPGKQFTVNRLAYKKGMFFYLDAEAYKQGKLHGVIINRVFVVTKQGKAVHVNHVVGIRNGMPLSNHRTRGGQCTAQRVWHQNLNNNLVASVQRIELHLGKHVPMNTAYRTYEEQRCLWYAKGQNPSVVARPGQSNHNRGLAIDVDTHFANQHASTFREFGLCRPMAHEPWHFEPCGIR